MCSFVCFFFSSRRRHTRSVSAFLLNRSSDLRLLFLAIIQTFFLISWFSLLLLQLLRHLFYRHLKLHRQRYILRSEERRVGKECRLRGSSYHEKNTQDSTIISKYTIITKL